MKALDEIKARVKAQPPGPMSVYDFIAHLRRDTKRLVAALEKCREQRDEYGNRFSPYGYYKEIRPNDDAELEAILEGKGEKP